MRAVSAGCPGPAVNLSCALIPLAAAHETLLTTLRARGAIRYIFYDGPPFATGLPHYGHILAGTIKARALSCRFCTRGVLMCLL